jgi:hypothetical protein
MKIQGAASFALPRDRLWEKLLDPTILQAAIPGCERLERVADGDYRASVSFGIAAIKGRFIIRMTLSDLDPPTAYTLAIDGEGGPASSRDPGASRCTRRRPSRRSSPTTATSRSAASSPRSASACWPPPRRRSRTTSSSGCRR